MENKAVYYAKSLKSEVFLITETFLRMNLYNKAKLKTEALEANVI